MTFGIVAPALIGPGVNPPAYSPVGGSVVNGTISLQDLARGVAVYANRYEGGQEVVRAAMDGHCSAVPKGKTGIQFIAFTEEEAYGYLQYDGAGNTIPECIPIITLRKADVLTDARIDLLVDAFKKRLISIEYVMGGKDNGVYSDEIDRLGRKLINAEVGDYVLVFDQSDSVMMRRRHNTSEPHIKTIADILSRQYPKVGFISNGTGPGNAIIESVRRAEIFVGKKLTTFDKIYGFSGVTHKAVVDNWEKGFGYQWVGLEHAWKHPRAGQGSPELLDLPTVSAVLGGNRHTLPIVQHPTVVALRQAMAKAKVKGKKKGKKGGGTSSRAGFTYSPEALQSRRGGLPADLETMLKEERYTHRHDLRGIAGLMLRLVPGRAATRATSMDLYSTIKSTPSIQDAATFANSSQRRIKGVMSVYWLGALYVSIVEQGDQAAMAYLRGISGRPGGSIEGQQMRQTLEAMTVRDGDVARYQAAHARWIELSAEAPSNVVGMRKPILRKAA